MSGISVAPGPVVVPGSTGGICSDESPSAAKKLIVGFENQYTGLHFSTKPNQNAVSVSLAISVRLFVEITRRGGTAFNK